MRLASPSPFPTRPQPRAQTALGILACIAVILSCSGEGVSGPQNGPPARAVIIGGQSQAAVVGTQLPVPISVRIEDAEGQPVPKQAVRFTVVSGGGSLFSGFAITSDDGIASDRWTLGLSVADSQKVEIRIIDNTGARVIVENFHARPLPDVPATLVKVSGDNQTAEVNSPLSAPLIVRILDRFSNPVPNISVSWRISTGSGLISTSSSTTNSIGEASALWTLGQSSTETQSAAASIGALSQIFSAVARPSAAVRIAIATPASGAASGAPFTQKPSVKLLDQFGNIASGASATITLRASAGATVIGDSTITASAGVAVFSSTGLRGTAGSYTLEFSAPNIQPATQTIELTAGAPARLSVVTAPNSATSGSSFATQPTVHLLDSEGNRTSSTAQVRATIVGSTATLLGQTSVASNGGVAQFSTLRIDKAGQHLLRFDTPDLGLPPQSASISVAPGAVAQIRLSAGAAVILVGASRQLTATLTDAFGNEVQGSQPLWESSQPSAITVSNSGLAHAVSAGLVTVTARLGEMAASASLSAVSVLTVAANADHTFIITSDSSLWAFGRNPYGQLGDSSRTDRPSPVKVMSGVKAVSAGEDHTAILRHDGSLWDVGNNIYEPNAATTRLIPALLMNNVRMASAGRTFTMIVKEDNSLWAIGRNAAGQLGDGTFTDKLSAVRVMSDVALVSAGPEFSLIVKTDGSLWATGRQDYGRSGLGFNYATAYSASPAKVMDSVLAVSAGDAHSLIVRTDGSLWATGYNRFGGLGDGTTDDRATPVKIMTGVSSVASSTFNSYAIKTDGSLWGMGRGIEGQLGTGNANNTSLPLQLLTGVSAISTGYFHAVALKRDGTALLTGSNLYGQLGNGTTLSRMSFSALLF